MIVPIKPPYEITNKILRLISSISEKIGAVNAYHIQKPSPELRKKNRIKTIKASLAIEGNILSEEQITAIIENKNVIGSKKDILEVVNALEVYKRINEFKPGSLKSFLKANQLLMKGLIDNPGKLRTKPVGIVKGSKVAHVAPPANQLNRLMKDLLNYYKKADDPVLIKSCVIHYEIEFIHPFIDDNGRMGRLWQKLILMQAYPVFEYLPFETIIKERQEDYYRALEKSDREGKSTKFIEFMLSAIEVSISELLKLPVKPKNSKERINYFLQIYSSDTFTRKDYLFVFKEISTATASRDLKYGAEKNLILKKGNKRNTVYKKFIDIIR